jgi:hypothetical protein
MRYPALAQPGCFPVQISRADDAPCPDPHHATDCRYIAFLALHRDIGGSGCGFWPRPSRCKRRVSGRCSDHWGIAVFIINKTPVHVESYLNA